MALGLFVEAPRVLTYAHNNCNGHKLRRISLCSLDGEEIAVSSPVPVNRRRPKSRSMVGSRRSEEVKSFFFSSVFLMALGLKVKSFEVEFRPFCEKAPYSPKQYSIKFLLVGGYNSPWEWDVFQIGHKSTISPWRWSSTTANTITRFPYAHSGALLHSI